MIKKEDIVEACLFLRKNNKSIPDETLNFIKAVSMRELEKVESGRVCFSCKHDGMQGIFKSGCTGCGVDGEYNNFEIKI